MRIRNLFYLLLALPLVFAACEKGSDDADKTPEVKEPVLTLTSKATVDVTATGGEFEITYTLENKKDGVELTATCDADWVDVTVGDKVKVVVEANEGDAREAKVVVAYETQKFEVTYKQVEKGEVVAPVLTLTSEATLEVAADGGDCEITYTLENPAEGVELEATCEADWVTNLTVGEKVTFTVAANEGDARETKVVVVYGEQSFEVAVKQAAKAVTPTPEFDMELEMVQSMRLGADYGFDGEDYEFMIAFCDESEEFELVAYLIGSEGDTVLQPGTYSVANSTVDVENMTAGDEEVTYMFKDAEVVVALEEDIYDIDMVLTTTEDKCFHFTFNGEIENMELVVNEPTEFVPVNVTAEKYEAGNFYLQLWVDDMYYHELDMYDNTNPNDDYLSEGVYSYADGSIGTYSIYSTGNDTSCTLSDAQVGIMYNDDNSVNIAGYIISSEGHHIIFDWSGEVDGFNFASDDVEFVAQFFGGEYYEGPRHNYYFVLSDVEVDGNQAVEGATYYYFDVYSDELNENLTLPNGVYTFDITNSYADGTFTEEYGFGFYAGGSQDTVWYMYDEGSTLTVTDGKIVAELLMEDGSKHTVTYEGDLSFEAAGGSELTEDMEINVSGWTIYAEYYDQFYSNDTDNWYVSIYEDFESGNGRYFVLDLLADFATSVDYRGTFTASDSCGINTFMPGYIDDGYLAGSWYAELEDGSVSGIMAPLTDGTITVTYNGDGTQTFAFDCRNDLGYKITGTVQGAPLAGGYAAEVGGKHSLVVNPSEKQVIKF